MVIPCTAMQRAAALAFGRRFSCSIGSRRRQLFPKRQSQLFHPIWLFNVAPGAETLGLQNALLLGESTGDDGLLTRSNGEDLPVGIEPIHVRF